MAKYPAMTTTNAGLNVIGEANTTGVAVIFTKIVAGDGDVPEGTSIADLTSVISPHLEIATVHGENLGNGQYQLKGTLDNSTLETGFRAKEIGVYAKAGEDGEENLFAYTNGGNYTDYIPDKRTPIDAQDFYIDIVVGNANEVEIIVSDENYVTREDVDILIGDHDAKYESHRDVYGKFIRQKSTAYSVGDVVYLPNLGAKLYLECTAGGTTDSSYLTITSPVVNMLVTDGTVTWKIRKISSADGVPIATILAYSSNGDLPSGYLLCDGSAVSRTMFPDLFAAIGTTYGSGDGSTTFNVPDFNTAARFAQGGTVAGVEKEAGLPNIEGKLGRSNDGADVTPPFYGAFNAAGALGYSTGLYGTQGTTGTGTQNTQYITFNASRSNPIYGNSDTVQPESLTVRYIIKAFDGQTADSALIDITQYAQELAGKANITGSNLVHHRDVITTSGTYTAPVTGLYKITVKGGGGGGQGGSGITGWAAGGGGGGEGGTTIGYEHMTTGQTATVVIGAGGTGSAGTSGNGGGSVGSNGGDSSVTVNNTTYTAGGGSGAISSGGTGGTGTIKGASGMPMERITTSSTATQAGGIGGGENGGNGGQGTVGSTGISGGNGGDGYVWFEYYTPGA